MTEPKFTKGAWRKVNDAQGTCGLVHPEKDGVAIAWLSSIHIPSNGYVGEKERELGRPEREANAALIGSAPDLYEALERILHDLQSLKENSEGVSGLHLNGDVADWDSLSEGGQFSPWLGDAENIARAALSKARGETP